MIVYSKENTKIIGMIWARGIGANIACVYGLGLSVFVLGSCAITSCLIFTGDISPVFSHLDVGWHQWRYSKVVL